MILESQRFSDKYIPVTESGCWIWIGYTDRKMGYGMFWLDGTMRLSHRVAYEAAYGKIHDGMHVCHSCDTPSCVNPDHLWLGTNADNVADKIAKGRGSSMPGEAHPGHKLTAEQVRYIRSCEKSQRQLAREMGVDRSTIGYIRKGKLWSCLEDAS